jgi:EF-P beta-lysylation protein EpmB
MPLLSQIPVWRKIQRRNFTQIDKLLDFLKIEPALQKNIITRSRFPLNLPYRLAEKIQKNTLNDPILRQFVPLSEELQKTPGFIEEPVLDSSFQKAKKTLHKYKGRALILTCSACAMHCRYCFRQNFPYETAEKNFEEDLDYLRKNPHISEVILSGGDPLSLSDTSLNCLLLELEKIPHIQRIRFHTRFPIGIPERIDHSFLSILASVSKQIIFVVHVNHPRELDSGVISALKQIQKLSIPVLNQTVLLKGVNDAEETLLTLCENLTNAGIIPYYLHALDPVSGASHFQVSDGRGLELIDYLQSHLSGYGVPRFVREKPGCASKTPITQTALKVL